MCCRNILSLWRILCPKKLFEESLILEYRDLHRTLSQKISKYPRISAALCNHGLNDSSGLVQDDPDQDSESSADLDDQDESILYSSSDYWQDPLNPDWKSLLTSEFIFLWLILFEVIYLLNVCDNQHGLLIFKTIFNFWEPSWYVWLCSEDVVWFYWTWGLFCCNIHLFPHVLFHPWFL